MHLHRLCHCVCLLAIGLCFAAVSLYPGLAAGQSSDLRAARETLTIAFTGDAAGQRGDLEAKLRARLSGRFDIVDGPPAQVRLVVSFTYKDEKKTKVEHKAYLTYDSNTVSELKLLDLDLVDEIVRGIAKVYPMASRIISVSGSNVVVDMGSNVGLKRGNRLQVFDSDNATAGLIKVTAVRDIECDAHVVRGGARMGYRVSPQFPLRGGLGLEYTQFEFETTEVSLDTLMYFATYTTQKRTGRRAVLYYEYRRFTTWPLWIGLSTGYIEFGGIAGWYALGLDLSVQQELLPDLLFVQAGGGGGLSLVDWRERVYNDAGDKQSMPLGVWSYEGAAGLRLHFTRAIAVSLKAGMLGYSRYPSPDNLMYKVAISWNGT